MNKNEARKILGVKEDASDKDLKKAYRDGNKKYHPDKLSSKSNEEQKKGEELFKKHKEAYEILIGKKEVEEPFNFSAGFHRDQGQGFAFNGTRAEFERFIHERHLEEEQLRREAMLKVGINVSIHIYINYKMILNGGTIEVEYPDFTICDKCNGSGGSNFNACNNCAGSGFINSDKKMKVKIPKDIFSGKRLRVSGKGYPKRIKNGNAGDLIFIINYETDDYFKYNNGNYYINVIVSLDTWILGGDITIATFSGSKRIKILPMASLDEASLVKNEGLGSAKLLMFLSLDKDINKDKILFNAIKDLGSLIEERGLNTLVEVFNEKTIEKIKEIESGK